MRPVNPAVITVAISTVAPVITTAANPPAVDWGTASTRALMPCHAARFVAVAVLREETLRAHVACSRFDQIGLEETTASSNNLLGKAKRPGLGLGPGRNRNQREP